MQWLRPDSVILNPETRSTLAAQGVRGNLRRSQRNDPRHETRYRPGGNRDHCYGGVSRIIGALSGTIRPERLERRGINQKGRRSNIRPPLKGFELGGIHLGLPPDEAIKIYPSMAFTTNPGGGRNGVYRHHEGDYRVLFHGLEKTAAPGA